MRRGIVAVALVAILSAALLATIPAPVDPQAWDPPEAPATDRGPYAVNDRLRGIERIAQAPLHGPEYVDVDDEGRLYAGYVEGAILRFTPDGHAFDRVADTGGRPLGFRRLRDGGLIVADGRRGLLRVAPNGSVSVLVGPDSPMAPRLVDDAAVTADESTIFFTDASDRFGLSQHLDDILEHGGRGRLLRHDLASGATTVLMRGLQFANGVALGPGDAYLVLSETGSYRLWRWWLSGPRANEPEVFVDNLPGFPDNVTFNGSDRFWVALANPRNRALDVLGPWPRLRRAIWHLPDVLRPKPVRHAIALAFDTDGRLVANLQDAGAGAYAPVTTVRESGEMLYFGSLDGSAIGRVPRS